MLASGGSLQLPAGFGRYHPRSHALAAGIRDVSAPENQPVVMVVDDEPELRALLAEYFGRHGFVVRQAEDAAVARRLVAEQAPALAILDVNMPGENGLSLARFLREAHPRMGLVMLTTAGESVDRIVGLELGADDYLPKPFEMRELLARVRSVLRRASASAPASPADRKSVV